MEEEEYKERDFLNYLVDDGASEERTYTESFMIEVVEFIMNTPDYRL
jgi:hypothetical protein